MLALHGLLAFGSTGARITEDQVDVECCYDLPVESGRASGLLSRSLAGGYAWTRLVEELPALSLEDASFVLAAVDLDGDGADDILINDGDGALRLADTRVEVHISERSAEGRLPCGPQFVGDWNGDGREDLASSGAAWVSDGVDFQLASMLGPSDETSCNLGRPIVLGDVEGDGGDDLLVYQGDYTVPPPAVNGDFRTDERRHGGRWALFLSSDLREGSWPPRWTVGSDTHAVIDAVAPLDVDGDGRPELVAWLESEAGDPVTFYGELVVYGSLEAADGPTELARQVTTLPDMNLYYMTWPRVFPVGDWDGDGDDDLLVDGYGFGEGHRAILDVDLRSDDLASVVDTLDLPRPTPGLDTAQLVAWPTVADFDGDGSVDVVYSVMENSGTSRGWFTGPGRDFPTAFVESDTELAGTQRAQEPAGCSHTGGGLAAAAGIAALVLRRVRQPLLV